MPQDKEKAPRPPEGKFMSAVKIGPKGQIVIPKEAREMFGLQPGDTLLLLADVNQGIALQRFDFYQQVFDQMFTLREEPAESEDE